MYVRTPNPTISPSDFRTSSPGPHPCRSQCRMQESSHARASAADSGLHSPKCLIISPSPKISSKIARSSGVHCRRISLFVSSRYLRPTSPFLFLKPRFAANSSGSSALVAFRSRGTFTSSWFSAAQLSSYPPRMPYLLAAHREGTAGLRRHRPLRPDYRPFL